ncbi:MAG TPA: hydrogenase nickel incorporation protein HypB [Phycisphaerae bacterium]|nr:hydrogenase nickel incorporation protein HypB [Phycisphaerae bacterium]
MMTTIEVLRNVFQRNDDAACENRALLDRHGIVCFNLLGGAGSGKTSILEELLRAMKDTLRVAVLEGDLATTRDSERIARLDVPVIQLLTDGGCHLNATLVQQALARLSLESLDLIIIENVGNPICPANFNLGEHDRISVLSVAEGDDKPSKYPLLFKNAALILLTKCDLLPHTNFKVASAIQDIRRINSHTPVVLTSARTHSGIDELEQWIVGYVRRKVSGPRTPTVDQRRHHRATSTEPMISTMP